MNNKVETMEPRSLTEWRLAIQEVWDAISNDILKKFWKVCFDVLKKH